MISVKHLCKSFGQFDAVKDLTFDVKPGDIVGFLGPNGAGKSTTMKMLTGFITPTSGQIEINGLPLASNAKRIQSQIGYLPEGAPAYGDMTVYQFLYFIANVRKLSGSKRKERLAKVIEQTELYDVLDKPIDLLSKGFKRRVGLAQAIIHDPQILILDEPTDGLDPNQKHQVRELIQTLAMDKIVIVSTHILEEVTAVCNRVMIIAKGEKRFDDTPVALQQESKYYNAVTLTLSYAADISGLAELEGVDEMEVDRFTGAVTLFPESGATILPVISEHIQHRRLPVDSVYAETGRLEEVFRRITEQEVSL